MLGIRRCALWTRGAHSRAAPIFSRRYLPNYCNYVQRFSTNGASIDEKELRHNCSPRLSVAMPTIACIDGYKQVMLTHCTDESPLTLRYFVDVPPGIYPGETFTVLIDSRQHLIDCPEITTSGERIVVIIVDN